MFRIVRDEVVIARLIARERSFWDGVERDVPPAADGSDSADLALRCLYPKDSDASLDFCADSEMGRVFSDLLAVRAVIATQTALEAELRQRIQQRMGEATRAVFDTGEVSWKLSKDSSTLDTARLLQDQPSLAQRYALARPGSRRFLVQPRG